MSQFWTPARFWVAFLATVGVVVILCGVYLVRSVLEVPERAARAGREIVGDLTDLAAAFRQGTVKTTFINHAAQLSGGNKLVVAELHQTEIFTRTESSSVLWGALELPDVVVEARVPVEYSYFLDLAEAWEFELVDHVLRVRAPRLRFSTPALDVSLLEFDVRASSLLRDEDAALAALKAGLTELSRERARAQANVVRETARRHAQEFVRNWLEGAFEGAEVHSIEVMFGDEPEGTVPTEPVPGEGATVRKGLDGPG